MKSTLAKYGVHTEDLENTSNRLKILSSTNGAGGVLDLFYPRWKIAATLENQKYYKAASDLIRSTYGTNSGIWEHPFGPLNPDTPIYAHVDRIGYRLPDVYNTKSGSRRVQRALAPHLDCCPSSLYGGGGKEFPRWRPIQSMICLTETKEANQGGFEASKEFHRKFNEYFRLGEKKEKNKGESEDIKCVGDFCPIRASSVIESIKHIPLKAGSAVFWDQRDACKCKMEYRATPTMYLWWLASECSKKMLHI